MTGTQLGALGAAVAALALLPGRSFAKAPGTKKVEIKTVKAAPAEAHGPIGHAVGQQVMGEVRGHASLCAVVNAVRATPCASRVLAEKLIPQLLPIEIKNVAFRKKDAAELAKLAKDGRTEAPPPELAGLPEDMDLSLTILALEVSPSQGLETVGIAGKLHLEVKTPNNPAIKSTVANLKFTGVAHVVYAPDAAHCQKAAAGGEAMRLYVSLVLATITVETLSTERS